MDRWTKPIVVIWVNPETRLQRVIARDRSTYEDARNRIGAQMPLDLKRSKADIVINNAGIHLRSTISGLLAKAKVLFFDLIGLE